MTPHYVRPPHSPLPQGHRYDGVGHDGIRTQAPAPSTAPPGLWKPAPEVVAKPKPASRTPRPSRAKPASEHKPRTPAEHGTDSGYKRHNRAGTEACGPCREAHRIVARRYAANRPRVRRQPERADCGTEAGYDAHRARKERICDPCRLEHNAKQRERRATRYAAEGKTVQFRQPVALCGTSSGYKRHRRNGEQSCEPCLTAKRADDQALRGRKRAA